MKTKLDLYTTAHSAAVESLPMSSLDVANLVPNSFKAAGHDAGDFDYWQKLFQTQRDQMLILSRESTPAQLAAATPAKP
jgi:hypothetical protein